MLAIGRKKQMVIPERERDCGSEHFPFHEPHSFLPVGVGPMLSAVAKEGGGGWNKPQLESPE